MKRLIKPTLGIALLLGLVLSVDAEALWRTLRQADPAWCLAALLLAVCATLLCVKRWQRIARDAGICAPYGWLMRCYFQGISANSVLPGGILGGDVWRSAALGKRASAGHEAAGAASVFLDRVSGFWGLAALSVLASLWCRLTPNAGWFDSEVGALYMLVLCLAIIAPFILAGVGRPVLVWLEKKSASRPMRLLLDALLRIAAGTPFLRRTLLHSLAVQLFTIGALWASCQAIGLTLPLPLLAALCGGIFLAGVLPAAVGGFGARELGALAFLVPFGFSPELVLAGSIVFGLTATAQGLIGLLFWFEDHKTL